MALAETMNTSAATIWLRDIAPPPRGTSPMRNPRPASKKRRAEPRAASRPGAPLYAQRECTFILEGPYPRCGSNELPPTIAQRRASEALLAGSRNDAYGADF